MTTSGLLSRRCDKGKVRLRDWFVRTANDDVAIKIVIEATTRAREVETGLITTVA